MRRTMIFFLALLVLGTPLDQAARTINIKEVTIGGPSPKTKENLEKRFGVYGDAALKDETLYLSVGEYHDIEFINVLPMAQYEYKSLNKSIATVNKSGQVKGIAHGTTFIECKIQHQDTTETTLQLEIVIE